MTEPADSEAARQLRESAAFRGMPEQMQAWILASPNASADFAGFFAKGGELVPQPNVKLPYYSPQDPPRIFVDAGSWDRLGAPGTEYAQRHVFGTLAHEIGHDRFNTGTVPFTGRTAEEYVQYRAGLEAQAIFNAFPIFKDLERHPDFKQDFPFNSIGYLSGLELGQTYKQWRNGELDDKAVVDRIAAQVPDRPYTLGGPLQDQNADGRLTHRDLYLRDYAQYIAPKLEPQASVRGPRSPADPDHPDHELLDKLRDRVRGLDQQAGKGWDENSERMAASALVMAKRMGFTAEDDPQLTFNKATEKYGAGELFFVARMGPTASPDPAANLAHMPTAEALSKPVQERYQEVEAINRTQAETLQLAQQQAIGPDDPSRSGPVMRM